MNKLKNAIVNNNDNTEVDDDTLLSYYDLLTYLKFGITFKKRFHIRSLIKKLYTFMMMRKITL